MAYMNGNHCSNCEFWGGNRKVSSFKDKAEVSKLGDEGICSNPKCTAFKGKKRRADDGFSCSQFLKWSKLK